MGLKKRVEKIESDLSDLIDLKDLVDCEVCGCMIMIDNAIPGKPEVRQEQMYAHSYPDDPEYIYHPYYCKRCAKTVKKGGVE